MKKGDKVKKTKGYKFEGTIVSVFKNSKGEKRYVVEHKWGWLMIFSGEQLQ